MNNIHHSAQTINEAYSRIKPFVKKTPVVTSHTLNSIVGANLYFKCENFQSVGAFKYRGATNAVLQLPKSKKLNGVATHSSGNHGQALAKAATVAGIKSYIVMPRNAPKVKIDAVLAYGGQVIFCEPTLQAREENLEKIVTKTGATFIHPFNNNEVIAGQATCAKEFFLQIKNQLNIIIAPVGGGGLISGTALATKFFSPKTSVWGAEPQQVNDAYLSFTKKVLQPATENPTIADGLKTSLGSITFPIIINHVEKIVTVTEQEIIEGMKLLWERLKIVVEPSSAVAFSAIFKSKELVKNLNIGIILTGGNVDLNNLPFNH